MNGTPKILKIYELKESIFPRIQKSVMFNLVNINSMEIKFTQVLYLNIKHTMSLIKLAGLPAG